MALLIGGSMMSSWTTLSLYWYALARSGDARPDLRQSFEFLSVYPCRLQLWPLVG